MIWNLPGDSTENKLVSRIFFALRGVETEYIRYIDEEGEKLQREVVWIINVRTWNHKNNLITYFTMMTFA